MGLNRKAMSLASTKRGFTGENTVCVRIAPRW
jgi:hypothetical protein